MKIEHFTFLYFFHRSCFPYRGHNGTHFFKFGCVLYINVYYIKLITVNYYLESVVQEGEFKTNVFCCICMCYFYQYTRSFASCRHNKLYLAKSHIFNNEILERKSEYDI